MIIAGQQIGITISEVLYGLGIVLMVLGTIIIIQGFRARRKEKKNFDA